MNAQAAEEALDELSSRIDRAITYLAERRSGMEYGSPEYRRLTAKIEGLALAGSYLDDERRIAGLMGA